MDRNLGKSAMDQQKNYEQVRYSNIEPRNDGPGSTNQRYFQDPSSNINTNLRPPGYNMSIGARPVLNYSIQTGEEFALEFMRERVNPRQHFIPNAYGDPNSAPAYMDLKGMLGISHTGSENGSDISMINSVEKSRAQDFERKGSSVNEEKSYHDSVRSAPQTSSRNDIGHGLHGYSSSGTSRSLSTKVKFLCSFGGKILPRPSDGRLRYVGGETRIVRISKDISWQELMQKTLTIYSQTHTIKYQLPGEDLDALVSVSCDEDLQNMMEECNILQDGGSQKPRIFLFSSGDLEDVQLGLGTMEGDSEIQYVVAVNGMDLGSRKNSFAIGSTSGNNLDELLSLNVGREQASPELVGASIAASTVHVPSSARQSSQRVLPSSTSAYESNTQAYRGLNLHPENAGQHPSSTFQPTESFPGKDGKTTLQYSYSSHSSNYATPGDGSAPMLIHGHASQQGVFSEEQLYAGFHLRDSEVSTNEMKLKGVSLAQKMSEPDKIRPLEKEVPLKEAVMKRESSLQKINETDKSWTMENEHAFSSHPHDVSTPNYVPREEPSFSNSAADVVPPSMCTKSNRKVQEHVQNSISPENVSEGKKNNLDSQVYSSSGPSAPGYGASEADPAEFSSLEPPVVPQPIFNSERIPREQAELNRLSKSDDSFGSQFLITQALSDHSQPISNSVSKLHDENVAMHAEQSSLPSKPLQKIPQIFAESINKTNSNIAEEVLDAKLKKPDLRHGVLIPGEDYETSRVKDLSINDKEAAGLNHQLPGQGPDKPKEGSALSSPELERKEIASDRDYVKNTKNHAQPLSWTENPITGVTRGESTAGVSTSEHGDILIDINDRFPRDFLSDIFLKARISQNLSGISPLPGDGTGVSFNMENHEPKSWSYFRKLAQNEFERKDVSLMDQDHIGFSSLLANAGEGVPVDYSHPPLKSDGGALGHIDSNMDFVDDIHQESTNITVPSSMNLHSDCNPSHFKEKESEQLDVVDPRIPESDYEDGKLDIQNTALPLVELTLDDFDISTLQIIKNEDLEELRELGSGTFGTVYHGKWRGTDVAIKRIKKSCFTGRSSEQERLTVEFWREAEILSKLHHPNVVAFYGVVQDGPGGTLATVTEFMVNGSLRHVLLSKERYLDRRKRLIIAMDAAFGMEYLHSKNIVHFDLKCDNLLVNLKDPLRPICKVGDFGLSKIKRNTLVTGGVRGTLPWMAPELLNGSSSKVSEKVDVFSFGIVLWEILTGEEPYANMHYGAIIGGIVNNTLRPPVPSYCDSEWRLLMEQCWAPDPVARPSFTEIARRLRVMSAASQSKPQGHHPQSQVPK
ncbi:Mitogen-activated protein kinase kinase kinase [Trema orientale]|uniref:Mitogen-activated protein kinase kinase kinase n=1 Tax=Trema orientale TaxID=63057 RepID=A0A2P5EK86_TREOI|nr:Mitogen-activated protein kinase kinase kinase [Trema orientale]